MKPRPFLLVSSLLVLIAASSAQTTLNVPGSFPSIQSAIIAASSGDTVSVAPGTYLETINFLNKSIGVVSTHGAAATIIDAQGMGTVVTFGGGESLSTLFEGFTIRGGVGAAGMAGGVHMGPGCAATVRGCIIRNNVGANGASGTNNGAGVVTSGGAGWPGGVWLAQGALIIQCEIRDNVGGIGGAAPPGPLPPPSPFPFANPGPGAGGVGGMLVESGASRPSGDLLITGNIGGDTGAGPLGNLFPARGGSGGLQLGSTPVPMSRLRIIGNNGGMGIGSGTFGGAGGASCSGVLADSLIVQNTGGLGPGVNGRGPGGALLTQGTLRHCTVADNIGSPGGVLNDNAPGTIHYSIVWGNRFPSTAPSNVQTIGAFGMSYYGACIESGVAGNATNAVIVANPLFVAPPSDYRLQSNSPCRDSAPFHVFAWAPSAGDIERRPRSQGSTRDRGAYEFGASVSGHLGTFEDVRLATTINGGGNADDWERTVAAGSIVNLAVTSPGALFTNGYPVLGADATIPGSLPLFPQFPELHLGATTLILVDGIATNVPLGAGISFSATIPNSLSGTGVRIKFQGIVVSPSALNGLMTLTDAHDIVIS